MTSFTNAPLSDIVVYTSSPRVYILKSLFKIGCVSPKFDSSLKKSNFRYNYFYHSSISSEAEFRWDEPENPDDPDEPEKPDEPENPDDDVFLSEKFSMIIISSEEHITPDSCRILSSSNSDSFSNPEHCSSLGFSDPAVIGSSK